PPVAHPHPRAPVRRPRGQRRRPPAGDRAGGLAPLPAPGGAAPLSPRGLRAPRQPRPLPPGRSAHRRAAGGGARAAAEPGRGGRREAERGAGAPRPARPSGGERMTPDTADLAAPSPTAASSPTASPGRAAATLARMRSLLPGPTDYRDLRRTWKGDLLAGVTVGIVALPLALGFGVSSGLTAEQGLITA